VERDTAEQIGLQRNPGLQVRAGLVTIHVFPFDWQPA
jgi:hypothetical protein